MLPNTQKGTKEHHLDGYPREHQYKHSKAIIYFLIFAYCPNGHFPKFPGSLPEEE